MSGCVNLSLRMTTLIIHGHFYQPPRENPWTGLVDPEPSAQPFHDWNERIHAECYAPNAAVRILDPANEERVVNNYVYLSFNFGPTLLSWLEQTHRETYQLIVEADAESVRHRRGHGNAIAQAYSHAILPLCNKRDRVTQVRWGLADFRFRFNRDAESMWLPETACNKEVLDLLIDEGLRFVILAPQQAARVRPIGSSEWAKADDLDTSIVYRYQHSVDSAKHIAVFFYEQKLAHAIAFERALTSSAALVDHAASVANGDLVSVATDGETYGHHHKFGDLCLAYAMEIDAPARGFTITNFGEYLDAHPPAADVEISLGELGEGSSWSCIHGVSRWIRDCGCATGGERGWRQGWRTPLRQALDYLRDTAGDHFEQARGKLFTDPWAARNEAIDIFNSIDTGDKFFAKHAPRALTQQEQQQAWLYLQMQRDLLLMYASCGWFFNDIAGIEPVQILKYAAHAIDLMGQLNLPSPRARFLEILATAKSNRGTMGTGADVYRQMVEPTNPAFRGKIDERSTVLA